MKPPSGHRRFKTSDLIRLKTDMLSGTAAISTRVSRELAALDRAEDDYEHWDVFGNRKAETRKETR